MSFVRHTGISLVVIATLFAGIAAVATAAEASPGGEFEQVEARFSEYENLAWDHETCPGAPGVDASPVAYVRNVLLGIDLSAAVIEQAAIDLGTLAGGPVTVQSYSYGIVSFGLDPGVDARQVLQVAGPNLPSLHLNHVFSYDPFWRFSPYQEPTAAAEGDDWADPLGQLRRVVVLDTGYPIDGPGADYQLGDHTEIEIDPSQPTANHGPFIASQIARIAPGEIVLQRVLTERGQLKEAASGVEELFDELALVATFKAVDLDNAVVNMSFGTYGCEAGGIPRAIEKAILAETSDGAHFVAAAGNDETNAARYPASFAATTAGVTAVGAHDGQPTPKRACFSNFGSVSTWAPGVKVIGRLPDGSFAEGSGTSFAAPYVTAALSADQGIHSPLVGLSATVVDSDGDTSVDSTAC